MTINPKIFQLAKEAGATDEKGGSIDTGIISFTNREFEDFMTRYTKYLQDELSEVVAEAHHEFTYLGDDVPSCVLIDAVEKTLKGEK
jgi:hypothetical protein